MSGWTGGPTCENDPPRGRAKADEFGDGVDGRHRRRCSAARSLAVGRQDDVDANPVGGRACLDLGQVGRCAGKDLVGARAGHLLNKSLSLCASIVVGSVRPSTLASRTPRYGNTTSRTAWSQPQQRQSGALRQLQAQPRPQKLKNIETERWWTTPSTPDTRSTRTHQGPGAHVYVQRRRGVSLHEH